MELPSNIAARLAYLHSSTELDLMPGLFQHIAEDMKNTLIKLNPVREYDVLVMQQVLNSFQQAKDGLREACMLPHFEFVAAHLKKTNSILYDVLPQLSAVCKVAVLTSKEDFNEAKKSNEIGLMMSHWRSDQDGLFQRLKDLLLGRYNDGADGLLLFLSEDTQTLYAAVGDVSAFPMQN